MITKNDTTWLRWQLTQRGELLWHETCASCANWSDVDEYGWGECADPHIGATQANAACVQYEPHEETEP